MKLRLSLDSMKATAHLSIISFKRTFSGVFAGIGRAELCRPNEAKLNVGRSDVQHWQQCPRSSTSMKSMA